MTDLLYTFPIASADRIYNEIGRRCILLDGTPADGFRIRGEVMEGGAGTSVDLAQIILEYVMAEEQKAGAEREAEIVVQFGQQLGELLADRLANAMPDSDPHERVAYALDCVLRSIDVPHDELGEEIFWFDHCPLCEIAQRTGLRGNLGLARGALEAMCHSVIAKLDSAITIKLTETCSKDHAFAVQMVEAPGSMH